MESMYEDVRREDAAAGRGNTAREFGGTLATMFGKVLGLKTADERLEDDLKPIRMADKTDVTDGFSLENARELVKAADAIVPEGRGLPMEGAKPALQAKVSEINARPQEYGYLGQTFDKAPTRGQMRMAKMDALYDVYTKHGQDGQADRILARMDAQTARERNQKAWEKADKKEANEESYLSAMKEVDAGNPYSAAILRNAEKTKVYQDQIANPTVGVVPVKPVMEQPSYMELFEHQSKRLATMAKHGRADPKEMFSLRQDMDKLESEGTVKAMQAAQDGGTPEQVAEHFNKHGTQRIDPKNITIERVGQGEGMPDTAIIKIKMPDGSVQVHNSFKSLMQYGKAKDSLDFAQSAHDNLHKKRTLEETVRNNNLTHEVSMANVGIAGRNATTNEKRVDSTIAKTKVSEAVMPIDRQIEAADDRIKSLETSIHKAISSGSASSEGIAQLQANLASMREQRAALIIRRGVAASTAGGGVRMDSNPNPIGLPTPNMPKK
jgi:hypothetical protein